LHHIPASLFVGNTLFISGFKYKTCHRSFEIGIVPGFRLRLRFASQAFLTICPSAAQTASRKSQAPISSSAPSGEIRP
jgi:hypothetical protein